MEKNIYECLEVLSEVPGVKGCLIADEQGLCLAVKGKMPSANSGLMTAIADQANLLEPGSVKPPTIVLENENRQLSIVRKGKLTAAMQKQAIS
ncbi:Ragulator complex protein LAMTOR5 [Blattella germanica]|nr:Ragulator complex protein LAMTOR5 [Blattella germanica]